MMSNKKSYISKWKVLSREEVFSTPVFNIYSETAINPRNGSKWEFYTIKTIADWVNVIPITKDGNIVFVKQYRFGTKDFVLELPGGLIEEGEDIIKAAKRELKEETGFAGGEPYLLGKVYPNPAIQGNICYFVLIEGIEARFKLDLDLGEDIETCIVPLNEVEDMILNGKIEHGLALNGLYFYWLAIKNNKLKRKY